MNILELDRMAVGRLLPKDVTGELSTVEVLHIAKTLGGFWQYDYQAAKEGRAGLHAELKSGAHSDAFFVSRVLLDYPHVLTIMARQIVLRMGKFLAIDDRPTLVGGIPDSATKLGQAVSQELGVPTLAMAKKSDQIVLAAPVPEGSIILFVEDVCTRGTGFSQAVQNVKSTYQSVSIMPYDPVILNRGGLTSFSANGQNFTVVPVAETRITDWQASACPLCQMGSKPIKPKAEPGNWQKLVTSQLKAA